MRRRADEGSASVVVVGMCAMVAVLVAVVGLFGRASWGQSRAQTAADLSALAAADAARGLIDEDPCDVAADLARRHGARVTECVAREDLGSVKVTVTFHPGRPFKAMKAEAVAGDPES